jgi:hypothetical protein
LHCARKKKTVDPRKTTEWSLSPGDDGFNQLCRTILIDARLPRTLKCSGGQQDRWYQETIRFLVHPTTPIRHLLVCHQLGTGKTITMLRVLDNYFDDIRPRLLLFPTETVAENFYRELATQPNKYRTCLQAQLFAPTGPRKQLFATRQTSRCGRSWTRRRPSPRKR